MSFEYEDRIEAFHRRFKIEKNIAWLGGMVLGVSANIAAINPKHAEYPAIAGGSVFLAGIIAAAIEIYRLKPFYSYSPDDEPNDMDFESLAEVVELAPNKKLLIPEDIAA